MGKKSRLERYIKRHEEVVEETKRIAKSIGRSVAEVAPWTPFEEAEPIPQCPGDRIFVNSRYQVNVRVGEAPPPFGLFLALSIKTRDKAAHHDWRDFQRIKNEIIGERFEAVELYPDEARLVDSANQYYLFVFPELQFNKGWFPFGFGERFVTEDGIPNSQQRPFELKPKDLQTPEQFKQRVEAELRRRKEQANGQ